MLRQIHTHINAPHTRRGSMLEIRLPAVAMWGPSDSAIQRGEGFTSHAAASTPAQNPSFCSPHHLVQIYDVQLQTRMLTVFPISLSNALVVVPSKGYLASQHWHNQFMGPPPTKKI